MTIKDFVMAYFDRHGPAASILALRVEVQREFPHRRNHAGLTYLVNLRTKWRKDHGLPRLVPGPRCLR